MAVVRGTRYKLVHFGSAQFPPILFDLVQVGHYM